MIISLSLYGNLIRFKQSLAKQFPPDDSSTNPGSQPFRIEAISGTTAAGLLENLDIPVKEAQIIQCNGKNITKDYILEEGDSIGLFSLMSGG